jgi:cytochrome c oxidase subunit 1
MIGAKDLAFPRINLLSWYIYVIGALFTLAAMFAGGVDTGLDVLHALQLDCVEHQRDPRRARRVHHGLLVHPDRLQLHRHHPPDARAGHDWFRLPLFIWAHYATSLVMVLGTPVVAITILLVFVSNAPRLRRSSTRAWAATRCCSSTCSGSTRTRPSTS